MSDTTKGIKARLRGLQSGLCQDAADLIAAQEAHIADLEAQLAALSASVQGEPKQKMAPVQGYSAGIPWSLHLEAYDAYCKRYSQQPALIDLEGRNCRGGFGTCELDEFIPNWRDRASEIGRLKVEVATLRAAPPSIPIERIEKDKIR